MARMLTVASRLAACACVVAVSLATAWADEIAVVVNKDNPVSALGKDDISALFLGKSNAFPNGKVATPVNQSEGPVRTAFDEKALHKDPTSLKAYWAKMVFTGKAALPKELAGNAEVKSYVAGNPGAVGYIEKSAVDGSVKVVGTVE